MTIIDDNVNKDRKDRGDDYVILTAPNGMLLTGFMVKTTGSKIEKMRPAHEFRQHLT